MMRGIEYVTKLLAGRWQVPLALVAASLVGVTLYRLSPPPATLDFDAIMADVRALERGGAADDAIEAANRLLRRDPPLPGAQQAAVHDFLADHYFRTEAGKPDPDAATLRALLRHHEQAEALGLPATPRTALRAALANDKLGETKPAAKAYRAALDQELTPLDRRRALQSLVRLLHDDPGAAPQRNELLHALLADARTTPEYTWWALREGINEKLTTGDTAAARALYDEYAPRLGNSSVHGYADYLDALLLHHEDRDDEAEPAVKLVEQWLDGDDRLSGDLDEFGPLAPLARQLRGEILLATHRPEQALEAFESAERIMPRADRAQSLIGRGRALAALDRDDEARQVFREAAELEKAGGASATRTALQLLFAERRAQENEAAAAGYLALAEELTPQTDTAALAGLQQQLGDTFQAAGDAATDADERGRFFARAGRAFELAAGADPKDDERRAELLWSAAQAYDRAGQLRNARRMLRTFVDGRNEHRFLAAALLQLGQTYEAFGELDDALHWYGRVAERFPRLEEATRARTQAAGCLIAQGRSHYSEAERLLGDLLDSDTVAPDATSFRDALLQLSDLLYEQQRYGEAISRLEDFVGLYPQDAEQRRISFMLADAYRRSAMELRRQADETPSDDAAPRDRAAAESRARFRLAADRFAAIANVVAAGEEDESERVYARLAAMYQGDCLAELGTPEAHDAALAAYRAAAARFESEPTALAAHVRIAVLLLQRGETVDAARSIERANWLLRGLPEQAFAGAAPGLGRGEWDGYLNSIMASDLFREVLSGAQ